MASASAITKNLPRSGGFENDNVQDVPIDDYVFMMGLAGCALVYFVLHKNQPVK